MKTKAMTSWSLNLLNKGLSKNILPDRRKSPNCVKIVNSKKTRVLEIFNLNLLTASHGTPEKTWKIALSTNTLWVPWGDPKSA